MISRSTIPQRPRNKLTFEERVRELEEEGCTTSDAQSVAEVEASKGLIGPSPLTVLRKPH